MRIYIRVRPVLYIHNELLLIRFYRSIKVITITGLIILGIVIDLGGGPNHDRLGTHNELHCQAILSTII